MKRLPRMTRTIKTRKSKPKFNSQGLRSGRIRGKKAATSKKAVAAHNSKSMRRLGFRNV